MSASAFPGDTIEDSGFIELIEIIDDFINVDIVAFEKLFCSPETVGCPISIYLVLGPDRNASSSLISKLLNHKIKNNAQQIQSRAEDLSEAFMAGKKKHHDKSIVAWGQPVLGDMINGKQTVNFFIDIWGDFDLGHEDPLYIVLSGIACVLASSIVYVQPCDFTDSTWDWMKKTCGVALKTEKLKNLQKMTFLVQDWVKPNLFKMGEAGGKAYLEQILNSASKNSSIYAVHITIPDKELKCYLFPQATPENKTNRRQNFQKFERLVVDDGACKRINGIDILSSEILELVQGLPQLQTLLDFKDESPFQQILENEETNVNLETNRSEDMEVEKDLFDEYQNEEYADELEMNRFLSVNPEVGKSIPLESSFNDDTVFYDGQHAYNDDEDAENLNPQEVNRALKDIMTQLRSLGSIKISLDEKPQESELSENSLMAEDIIREIYSRNPPKHSESSNYEELLNRISPTVLLNPPVLKVNNMRRIFNFDSSSRRLSVDKAPNCFDEGPANTMSIPVHLLKGIINLGIEEDIAPNQQQGLESILGNVFETAQLQSERSIEDLMNEISQRLNYSHQFNSQGVEWAKQNLQIAFSAIVSYQNAMDDYFERELCFENNEDLKTVSYQIRSSILGEINVTLGGTMLELVTNKLQEAEDLYLQINKDAFNMETQSFQCTLKYAEEFQRNKMQEAPKGLLAIAEIEALHKEFANLATTAFSHAWASPTSKLFNKYRTKLDEKFAKTFDTLKSRLQTKYQTDMKTAERLVQKLVNSFNSDVDRNIKNPALSTGAQFTDMYNVAYSEAIRLFNLESILKDVKQQWLPKLETELKNAYKSKEQTISDKIVRLSPPQNVQASSGSKHSKVITADHNSAPVPPAAAVGIHFSLDSLSAGTIHDGKLRTLYEACPNIVSFGNEISIGGSNTDRDVLIKLRNILLTENINLLHSVPELSKRFLRAEEIVAFVLSKLNQIVTSILNISSIKYVIAFPTFFNKTQRQAMKQAVQIAGMDAVLVRETCGLACQYLYNGILNRNYSRFFVVIEDEESDSCDISTYESQGGEMQLKMIHGYNEYHPTYLKKVYASVAPGISVFIDKMNKNLGENDRFILRCANKLRIRNTSIIKKRCPGVKIDCTSAWEILEGSSRLASYEADHRFRDEWDKTRPSLSKILHADQYTPSKPFFSRISHTGIKLDKNMVAKFHEFVHGKIIEEAQLLEIEKKAGKELCHQKIQSSSKMTTEVKEKLQDEVLKLMREIEAELISPCNVREKVKMLNNM